MSVVPATGSATAGSVEESGFAVMKALVTSVILVFEDQNASLNR